MSAKGRDHERQARDHERQGRDQDRPGCDHMRQGRNPVRQARDHEVQGRDHRRQGRDHLHPQNFGAAHISALDIPEPPMDAALNLLKKFNSPYGRARNFQDRRSVFGAAR